ncbi:hypothetical protein ESB13_02660 [Filimonas effusa]|uniref:Gylcosyl hydrolase 115 C-terminal domain-containing protein n=2 Tax=Filimonas effusa TaxID=2508721 RepID=A0A4Q1DDD2_9BACT|nr:hypothetical protein ESB13_02660 [Filimonas effusa]
MQYSPALPSSFVNVFRRVAIALCFWLPTLTLPAQSFSFSKGKPVTIVYSPDAPELDAIVAHLLAKDLQAAMNIHAAITAGPVKAKGDLIVIGTAASRLVQSYLPQKTPVLQKLEGKWECYAWNIATNPSDPASKLFVIAGSDTRGTAYGVFALSEKLGVSPWSWWADVPVQPKQKLTITETGYCSTPPAVKYRGIFLNDEDWGLTPWSTFTYEPGIPLRGNAKGSIGPETYARIFELLLRLRANSIWPAMHESTTAFYLTPGNKEVADKYNIVVGTSHCEPLMRNSAVEWDLTQKGDYNYKTNKEGMLSYWEERLKELKNSENMFTIGLRGKHDGKMQGVNTPEENKTVLAQVLHDQRLLLQKYIDKDLTKIPQVFIPYKEVLDAYNDGLEVPGEVTLIWCDDNYGYLSHFPNEKEQARSGGNGIYYHASYWGRPHDYLWLGTANPALIYHQMQLAYEKKAREIWILNVGDIKPLEYQVELFMNMAWDIEKVRSQTPAGHLRQWLSREFGAVHAKKLLPVMQEYYRLAYVRKPEFMGNTRTEEKDPAYSVISDLPWNEMEIENRLSAYDTLSQTVQQIATEIPSASLPAFFELIQYPVQAATQMNRKLLYAQLARHGKANWQQSDRAYDSIISLTNKYASLLNGKWGRMMDCQPRKLPVFEKVQQTTAASPLPAYNKPACLLNGTDFISISKEQFKNKPIGLGYQGKALALKKATKVSCNLKAIAADSVLVELRLLPNHPVAGDELRFKVELNGAASSAISYKTHDRSEEWKENVLRNQAIRSIVLPVSRIKENLLTIEALDEGVVIDQVLIYHR